MTLLLAVSSRKTGVTGTVFLARALSSESILRIARNRREDFRRRAARVVRQQPVGDRTMRIIGLTLLALAPLSLSPASAADTAPTPPRAETPARAATPEVETLKERLSDKASDEQRVDNCRVAAERRGATPRPDCAATRSSSASGAERAAR
jgi:hypothetical protein